MDLSDGNGIWREVRYILRMEIIEFGDGLDEVLKEGEEFRMIFRYFLFI